MPEEVIKEKTLFRRFETPVFEIRKEGDKKTMRFPASSEAPVERWYGTEILVHDKKSVRLIRAAAGAMPLLFNHNIDDPIGMIADASVKDGRLMVEAELFSTDRAKDVQAMIDGGLRNVSIAYRVEVIEEDKKTETFRVTAWEPYEVSIVTVPADPSVGIGRGVESEYEVRMIRTSQPARCATTTEASMPDENKETTAVATADPDKEKKEKENKIIEVIDSQRKIGAADLEKTRKKAIGNLCTMAGLDENYRDHFIGQGLSLEEVSDEILKALEERGKSNPKPLSKIGLSAKETERFSLLRAIKACADKDWKHAGFELECIRAVESKLNKAPDPLKFHVPYEFLERHYDGLAIDAMRQQLGMKRDLTVATVGAGGYLVSTDNMGFIEILRNRSVVFSMGARRLSGLTGNVTVPKHTGPGTAYWLATEATDITESNQAFLQMALTPKTVGAYTEISRLLLLQSSPSAEGIVTDDLANVVAIAADLAAIAGTGGAQPQGVIGTSGVGSVTGTSLAYAGVLEFQSDVAAGNVRPVAGGYVTTSLVASKLMARSRFANTDTPLWMGNIWDGTMAGFRAMSSEQIPTDNMLFGDWQEVVIGEWGVLEVEVNPYANFKAGIIGVRAMYSMDVGVRRAYAFSLATSIT